MPASPFTALDRAPKRTALVEHFRSKIVAGELPPGTQLQSRPKMARDLGACKATLQDALDELKRDGFIESRPNEGTFVSEKPPHLSRIGFVLEPDPGSLWRAFMDALERGTRGEAEKLGGYRLASYENVTQHCDTLQYQNLLSDIKAHRVAGLIFRGDVRGWGVTETPFMLLPGIPRVVLGADPPDIPGAVRIDRDYCDFFDRALDYLQPRGRRRIALITNFSVPKPIMERFEAALSARGMKTKFPWIHHAIGEEARAVTELLMLLPAAERPDGVLVMSENLAEQISAGMLASHVQVGSDLDIVAHFNMPCVGGTQVPMRRLGWSAPECLRVAVGLIDRQQRGEPVPPRVTLRAFFEEEIDR